MQCSLLHIRTHTAVFVGPSRGRPAVCHSTVRGRGYWTRCIVSLTLFMCVCCSPVFQFLSRSDSILRPQVTVGQCLSYCLARTGENKTGINLLLQRTALCPSQLCHAHEQGPARCAEPSMLSEKNAVIVFLQTV